MGNTPERRVIRLLLRVEVEVPIVGRKASSLCLPAPTENAGDSLPEELHAIPSFDFKEQVKVELLSVAMIGGGILSGETGI